MTDALKKLGSGTLTTASVALCTIGTASQAIVKAINLCNKTTASVTATIAFDSVNIINRHAIAANDSLVIPMTHIVEPGKVITGSAGADSAIDVYISGIEVT